MKNRFLLLLTIIAFGSAILGTNLLYAQTCGFATGLGCSNTDYNNFGANSNNTAATIEYDNYVSAYHATVVREYSGEFKIWGEGRGRDGGTLLSPTVVNGTNFYSSTSNLSGTLLKVSQGSNGSGPNTQTIALTTDGLYAWGYSPGIVLSTSISNSIIFQKIAVNGKADGLPAGVSPTDVKMMFVTYQTIAITTCSGQVYVLSQRAAMRGATGDATSWTAVTTLSNVVAIRGSASALIALTSSGQLYTWGTNTYLGGAAAAGSRSTPTLMTAPQSASSIKMIGATSAGSGGSATTYYVLYGDGNLWTLGTNNLRQLGNFTSPGSNSTNWVQPRYNSVTGPVMNNIKWISPNEHDGNGYAGVNVINSNFELYNWGSDDDRMLGRTGAASVDPGIPGGLTYPANKILTVETGGHTTMINKLCEDQFGYVGHKVAGSMGDGVNNQEYVNTFLFERTPTIQPCGASTVPEINTVGTLPSTICNTTSLVLNPSPAGGTLSITAGAAIASLNGNTLTFNGAGTVTISYTVTTTCGSTTSTRTFTPTTCIAYAVSGNVWRDFDGNAINNSEPGTNLGTTATNGLWANLINSAGVVVASLPVGSNGAYSLSTPSAGTYSVRLSNAELGSNINISTVPASAFTLPGDNVYTGINQGGTANTGNTTGNITGISVTANVSNLNFGVRMPPVPISGTVFNDANGNITQNSGELGTDGGSTNLTAYLVDGSGNVISSSDIADNGTYSFPNAVPSTAYSILLSNTPGIAVGSPATAALPTGWVNTGESFGTNNAAGTGTETATPGVIAVTTPATGAVTGVNFAVQQTPTAGNGTNPGVNQTGNLPVNVPLTTFTNGSTSSDPAPGNIASIAITAIPSGATSITVNGVKYGDGGATIPVGGIVIQTNGSGVPTAGTIITVDPTSEGATTVTIPFVAIDNAGGRSVNTGSQGTAVLNLTAPFGISGVVFNDNNGTTGNANGDPVNGSSSGTNPLNLVVNLYDAAGAFITSAPVLANGTYNLTNVPAGTGYQVQLNTADNVGQTGENISLNPNTDITGNFVHVSSSDGVTPTNGINVVNVTANVTGSNFGINEGPTTNPGTIASTTNPGGTNSVPVTNSFGGTDPNGGAITSLTITNFPTGATSITIGATAYTAPGSGGANEWTGPVTVPTNTTGVPNSAISVDPVDGNTTVAIPFTVTDNAGLTSSEGTLNVPFSAPVTYSIAGTIFNDNNGTTGNANGDPVNGSNSGTNPLNLVVNLYDAAGDFVTSAPVLADGTYTLTGVPAGNGYQVQLNTADNAGQSGEKITDNSNANLTGNFVHVSSSDGVTPTDGINVLDINANVTGSNFGINEGPTADPGTIASTTNPGGTNSVPVTNSFGGTDPNGGAIASLTITNFPTAATSITIGATTYTAPGSGGTNEWTGPVTVPTNTTGVPNSAISVDPVDGNTTVAIPFTVTDNAGLTSSEGTLNVPFSAPTYAVSGTIYNDANGQTGGANGSLFNGSTTPLFVNLYDAAGTFIASAPVDANGAYTLAGVGVGTGYQAQVSSVQATGGTLSPNAALPGTYGNISSNEETGSPTDGIIAFDIVAANVTGLDFGIQRPPVADVITNDPTTSSAYSATPPTGFPIVSGFLSIPYSDLDAFSGTDPEDGIVPIAGNTVKIGTVNPNTKVYYDFPVGGARQVAVEEEIPNFDPAKLVFYGQIGSGSTSTPFGLTYSVRDAAGVFSAPSEYTFSTGGDPLPVKLSSFTAKKGEGQTAVLDWTTTAETNSEKFDVEHSTDAKIWNVITVISAKGESNKLARYHYTHTNPVAGQNLYRLKMTDLDGTSAYSRIVSLSFEDVASATFYPNPATDKVKIKLEGATSGDVTKITLFALDGKVAYTVNKLILGEIDVTNIQTGTYVVSITLRNGTTQNSKIVIVK